jgi:hypothetical protein
MANQAEAVFDALPAQAQAAFPRVLRALVTVSRWGAEPTARAAPLTRFAPNTTERAVVDALLDPQVRLPVAEGDGAGARVRLAHEALITHWERARRQLGQERDDLRTRAMVEEAYAEWRGASDPDKSRYLMRDPLLANALDLLRRWPDEFDAPTFAFIQASRRRARLRFQLTAAAAVVFALLAAAASALGVYSYRQEQRAQQLRADAEDARKRAEAERQRAEAERNTAEEARARTNTVLATSDFRRGTSLVESNDTTSEGMAFLARSAREGGDMRSLTRLWMLLQQRSFWLPAGLHGGPGPGSAPPPADTVKEIPQSVKERFARFRIGGSVRDVTHIALSGDGSKVVTVVGETGASDQTIQYRIWNINGTPVTGWITPVYEGVQWLYSLKAYLSFDASFLALEFEGWRETAYLRVFDLRKRKPVGDRLFATGAQPRYQNVSYSHVQFLTGQAGGAGEPRSFLLTASPKGDATLYEVSEDSVDTLSKNRHAEPVVLVAVDRAREWLMSASADGVLLISNLSDGGEPVGSVLRLENAPTAVSRTGRNTIAVSVNGVPRAFSLSRLLSIPVPAGLRLGDKRSECQEWDDRHVTDVDESAKLTTLRSKSLKTPAGQLTRIPKRQLAVVDQGNRKATSPVFSADITLTCLNTAGDRLSVTTGDFVTEVWALDFSKRYGEAINERRLFSERNTPTSTSSVIFSDDRTAALIGSYLWNPPNLAVRWFSLWDLDSSLSLMDRVRVYEDYSSDGDAQAVTLDLTGQYLVFVTELKDRISPVSVLHVRPPEQAGRWLPEFAEAIANLSIGSGGALVAVPDREAKLKKGLATLAGIQRTFLESGEKH